MALPYPDGVSNYHGVDKWDPWGYKLHYQQKLRESVNLQDKKLYPLEPKTYCIFALCCLRSALARFCIFLASLEFEIVLEK